MDSAVFTAAVLNPNSGEVALNMKQLVEDNSADARRRTGNNGANDSAWQAFNLSVAQDNQTVKHLATLGLVQAGQSGMTENQQTVDPVRTATGDAIVGGVGVSAEQVAANIANITTLTTAIITQTLAAVLPILVTAIGGALDSLADAAKTYRGGDQLTMSFLSVLKSINSVFGKVTAVVTPLEPVIAAVPVYGPAFDTIFNAIVGVEGLFAGSLTTAPAATVSAAKKTAVMAVVNATTATPIPDATLSATIDQIVAALNSLQGAQATVSSLKV